MRETWTKATLEETVASNAFYSLHLDTAGLNGFYAAIPGLDLPLFLNGTKNEYYLYLIGNSTNATLLQTGKGIIFLDRKTRMFTAIWGGFRNEKSEFDKLIFVTDAPPVYGASPDKVLIDIEKAKLEHLRGNAAGSYISVKVKYETLQRYYFK